jgi:tetratricopeptide (TPR) repeat protein
LNALPPSREARLLRATILQSRHEFPAALRELDALLAEAEDAQARLTQATVLTVIGAYERAREACAKLPPSVYAVACAASIDALTGEHERARRSLERALRAGVELPWLHSLLGEQAYWQGDDARAERELSEDQDRYSRALLADLALDRGAPIEGDELHLALAELARAEPGEAVARMEASIADSEARGDRVHKREEARFWLARGRAERALACARENWAVQHEPWDARVLLEAARTREDAAPVLAWLAQTRFASPRLHALAKRFSEAP